MRKVLELNEKLKFYSFLRDSAVSAPFSCFFLLLKLLFIEVCIPLIS